MVETEHDSVESKLNKMLSDQKQIKDNLPGRLTYLAIFVGAFAAVTSWYNTKDIVKGYGPLPEVITGNTMGESHLPETFIQLGGQRFYLGIDGKSVDYYIRDIRNR